MLSLNVLLYMSMSTYPNWTMRTVEYVLVAPNSFLEKSLFLTDIFVAPIVLRPSIRFSTTLFPSKIILPGTYDLLFPRPANEQPDFVLLRMLVATTVRLALLSIYMPSSPLLSTVQAFN